MPNMLKISLRVEPPTREAAKGHAQEPCYMWESILNLRNIKRCRSFTFVPTTLSMVITPPKIVEVSLC